MAIKKAKKRTSVEIDLNGSEGNAFVLLGYAKRYAEMLDYTPEEVNGLLTDMRSKDYEHLVAVMDKHFGHFITFYR